VIFSWWLIMLSWRTSSADEAINIRWLLRPHPTMAWGYLVLFIIALTFHPYPVHPCGLPVRIHTSWIKHRPFLLRLYWDSQKCELGFLSHPGNGKWHIGRTERVQWHVGSTGRLYAIFGHRDRKIWSLQINSTYQAFRWHRGKTLGLAPIETDFFCSNRFSSIPGKPLFTLPDSPNIGCAMGFHPDGWFYSKEILWTGIFGSFLWKLDTPFG